MSDEFVSSPATANLEQPENVFDMQNTVSDNLNKFQIRYARYLQCQNDNTAEGVSDPPCDLNTTDSFSELTNAYDALHQSMGTVETVYAGQTTKNGVTNETYDTNENKLEETYENVTELQDDLDKKLRFIQEQLQHKGNSPQRRLDSRFLINTILIIIVFCILYYAFFEL